MITILADPETTARIPPRRSAPPRAGVKTQRACRYHDDNNRSLLLLLKTMIVNRSGGVAYTALDRRGILFGCPKNSRFGFGGNVSVIMRAPRPAPNASIRFIDRRRLLVQRLDRQCDTLPGADAQRDQAALKAIAAHRVDEFCGQHSAGSADWMAVGDGAALDVDDVVSKSELAGNHDCDRSERLVDLDTLDRADGPTPPFAMPASPPAPVRARTCRARPRRFRRRRAAPPA